MDAGLLEPWHLVIILVIIAIVFGAGKLPQVGSALGQSIREFRREVHDDTSAASVAMLDSTGTAATTVDSTCGRCGARLAAGMHFCPQCGAAGGSR